MMSLILAMTSDPKSERARPMVLFAEIRALFSASGFVEPRLMKSGPPFFDHLVRERRQLDIVDLLAPVCAFAA